MQSNVLIGCIISAALFPAGIFAETPKPTFAKDIAPILYARCATCHRPGEVAPMSLMSYTDARPWARAIKVQVATRTMPPWHAEGEAGKWRNDRRLSQAEIDKIVAWVDAGAPRGDDSDMPAPPRFAQDWNSPDGRPPDVIIEAPEMKVPAEGESPWQYVFVKLPFQGDVWVAASQVVPGNRAAVHHVLVLATTLPPNATVDAEGRMKLGESPAPGTVGSASRASAAGARSPQPSGDAIPGGLGGFQAGWEPGIDTALSYGPGVAERIHGTHLLFNLHYQANGHATTDKTRVGLWLQKGPVAYSSVGAGVGLGSETFIVNGKELTGRYTAQVTTDILPPGMKTVPNIPAGDDNYHMTALLPIRQEMVLYSIQPHMHLRGRSMKYTAVYPDGREEELMNLPHYDFNWQIVYEFAKPITLPAGTIVRVDARWDNSANNKYNPRPDQDVYWGEQSWDEMFSPIMRAVVKLKEPIMPVASVELSSVR
jgi:Copper type II ascorbate-dependent monooxygenase, C-terminal domain